MQALKGLAAVASGIVAGATVWIVGELLLHGTCGIPVLHVLWCTVGPGESVGKRLDIFDWLALPVVTGVAVSVFWKVWVRGGEWFE
jgi:hypothetical protein